MDRKNYPSAWLWVYVVAELFLAPGALAQGPSPDPSTTAGENEPAEQTTEDTSAAAGSSEEDAAREAEAASEAEMNVADAEARKHFEIGRTLYDAGRFEQAGEEFEAAYELSGRPQLLYNVYVAYRDASNFDKAIEALRAYLDEVEDAPDRINLKARLASMEAAQAERQAERDAIEAAQRAEATQQAEDEPQFETRVARSPVPMALVGGGSALVAGAVATGIVTFKFEGDLDKVCEPDDVCPSSEQGKLDRTKALAVATDVMLFGGLAIVATGVVLRLTGALDEEREVPVALGCDALGCRAIAQGRF